MSETFFKPSVYAWHGAHRYLLGGEIGRGAYGVVRVARELATGRKVAIKRISDVFKDQEHAKHVVRELKLHRILCKEAPGTVVALIEVLLPRSPSDFDHVYVVMEHMGCDLHIAIHTNTLTDEHCKYMLRQVLVSLERMHSCGVLHRDLKPQNILVDADCTVRLCDFGMSRPISDQDAVMWSNYATTRWYRPPELCPPLVGKYSKAVDVWSAGCVFAEMLRGTALFPGDDSKEQLRLIISGMGKPPQCVVRQIKHPEPWCTAAIDEAPDGDALDQGVPDASDSAISLLRRMLEYDPDKRISAADALRHEYFDDDVVDNSLPVDIDAEREFAFDQFYLTTHECRVIVYSEMLIIRETHDRKTRGDSSAPPLNNTSNLLNATLDNGP
jgi:serine/threonine protein kinase